MGLIKPSRKTRPLESQPVLLMKLCHTAWLDCLGCVTAKQTVLMMKTAPNDMRTYKTGYISILNALTEKKKSLLKAQLTSDIMGPRCAAENEKIVQGRHHVIGLVQHESMPALDMIGGHMERDHGKDQLGDDDVCRCNHRDAPDGVDRTATV